MSSRPAVVGNTIAYCLFARSSGSTIVRDSASFSTDLILLHFPAAQSYVSLCYRGKFIYRPAFDCSCEQYLTMIPCMLYAEDFQLSYCVNELFTNSTTSTSHRGFPRVLPNIYGSSRRSLGRLLDADNPSSFTTCRNRRHRRVSTNEVHG